MLRPNGEEWADVGDAIDELWAVLGLHGILQHIGEAPADLVAGRGGQELLLLCRELGDAKVGGDDEDNVA